MQKKRCPFITLVLLACAFAPLLAQTADEAEAEPQRLDVEAKAANRRTALICLDQCRAAVDEANWSLAYERADLGISYDGEIPDLWYIKAVAAKNLDKPKADLIGMLYRALYTGSWVQYNRDAARLMYADLLSDTCECRRAIEVLDSEPYLLTSDADYIRAKSYYRLGDVDAAFALVKNARTLFPNDGRFPLLFFKSEHARAANREVAEYAASLIKTHTLWSGEYPEIMVHAADYASSKEEAERLLKAYSAQGLRNELHTVLSLKYGIISEHKALDSMVEFAPKGLSYRYLSDFVSLIKSEEVIALTSEWLTAFKGVLIFDTNGDDIIDLSAEYKRGRASYVRYDNNQDGVSSWQAYCDFGVPFSMALSSDDVTLKYGVYPSVSSLFDGKTGCEYSLTAESVHWSPLDIVEAPFKKLSAKFFIPVPKRTLELLSQPVLIKYASKVLVRSTERADSTIRFSMLNGQPQAAVYYDNSAPYAFGIFENGRLAFRNVDADGDGFYELTETYNFNPSVVRLYMGADEDRKLNTDLFGSLPMDHGTYMVQAVSDVNKDGRIEYIAEFLSGGGRVVSWDTDSEPDGVWDIRSVITDETEFTEFIHPVTKETVTIVSRGGEPIMLQDEFGAQRITRDAFYRELFWIGEAQGEEIAQMVINFFNHSTTPGVSILDIEQGKRLLVVSIGAFYFGEVFDEVK